MLPSPCQRWCAHRVVKVVSRDGSVTVGQRILGTVILLIFSAYTGVEGNPQRHLQLSLSLYLCHRLLVDAGNEH